MRLDPPVEPSRGSGAATHAPDSAHFSRQPAPDADPPYLLAEEAAKRMEPFNPLDATINDDGTLSQPGE